MKHTVVLVLRHSINPQSCVPFGNCGKIDRNYDTIELMTERYIVLIRNVNRCSYRNHEYPAIASSQLVRNS